MDRTQSGATNPDQSEHGSKITEDPGLDPHYQIV